MKQSDYTYSSLPNDVALKIASSLEVPDLSSLGCCSRVWRDLCGSDCLWKSLVRERWPLLNEAALQDPNFKGWRGFYKKQHKEVACRAASVVKFVEQCSLSESLEVSNYLKAIECLRSMQFGFKDVQMVLFKPKLNVLLNLVGLHYCLNCLQVPASHVTEALQSSKISDCQVCVKWWKFGRRFYGFRMRDESHSRCISLQDLATAKEEEVLGVLERGAIHEVLQVQLSIADSTSNLWSNQSPQ
ncbi:PREDICTED: uncharacterized protein LOC18603438 [Theobroma cacao]|uniref:Uncharacterized protein LOC18603438 n=1 Tax=Theobroma cacao TaxID=3641 RepID=A0AB32VBX0_THECC|nr:PREDICTED: uncharacterized protein LOC18603438 [Theobroma cacao]